MIGLLLFIVLLFKGTDCTQKYFFSQSTPIPIVQVFDVDHSVILASPVSFQNTDNSLVTCEVFTFNACIQYTNAIIYSNHKVNQLLKNCKEQFAVIEPRMIDFDSYHIRTLLPNEEIPSIS
jgi:hypothetical protein